MTTSLSRIDLNLLVAFKVLLEERNVTLAAKRLFITQPAMSKTLHRLRCLFDDQLFTRTAHGLIPTPRANELHKPLAAILEQLEYTLFTPKFNPAEAEGLIHISVPEIIAIGAIPTLLKKVHQQAPNLQIKTRNMLDDAPKLLASGDLDFAIYVAQDYPKEFEFFHLASNTVSCWIRQEHPLADKQELCIEDLVNYPHISLYLPNVKDSDIFSIGKSFRKTGRSRKIIFQTTQLLTALEVLRNGNSLMMGPSYLAQFSLTKGHFISKALPPEFLRLQPELYLIQHHRTLNSPLHKWIKERLFEIFRHEPNE